MVTPLRTNSTSVALSRGTVSVIKAPTSSSSRKTIVNNTPSKTVDVRTLPQSPFRASVKQAAIERTPVQNALAVAFGVRDPIGHVTPYGNTLAQIGSLAASGKLRKTIGKVDPQPVVNTYQTVLGTTLRGVTGFVRATNELPFQIAGAAFAGSPVAQGLTDVSNGVETAGGVAGTISSVDSFLKNPLVLIGFGALVLLLVRR